MVPFAGFEMPVLYTSIVDEHRAVRGFAGLFDVSHMGELWIRGRDAVALAQRLFSNDIAGAAVGRVRYGLLCQEDGGVVDDVTAYRAALDEVMLCVNAANISSDVEWVRKVHAQSGLSCKVEDRSSGTALLAIQGPKALEIADRVVDGDAPRPKRWRFREARFGGVPVWLSRTGYSGEDGYEIFAPAEHAPAIWDALVAAGGDTLALAGLGARDTLRTEMGYPLYGHELDLTRNPLAAGLERFLAFGTGFTGERALEALRATGPAEQLVGLLLEGRRVARPGYPILAPDVVGAVTSGTYAPSIERSIAIGYVPAGFAAPGTGLHVEIRGGAVPCTVTKIPFFTGKG